MRATAAGRNQGRVLSQIRDFARDSGLGTRNRNRNRNRESGIGNRESEGASWRSARSTSPTHQQQRPADGGPLLWLDRVPSPESRVPDYFCFQPPPAS